MALTNPTDLVVVITGCDTGFGAEIADEMCQREGFTIYPTCLTDEGFEKYKAMKSSRIRPVKLDVTNQEDVNRFRALVEAECPQGVYCVFNNAGIFAGTFIDLSTEDVFQKIMDVNYMGVVRITKALIPSLRTYAKSRHSTKDKDLPSARILTITSIASRCNPPGHAGYSASKHAVESFLDTLRLEMIPWEINVSMIEPFYAKTPMIFNTPGFQDQVWKAAGPNIQNMYGTGFIGSVAKYTRLLYGFSMPSKWVVDTSVDAVTKKNGARRARILIGFWWASTVLRLQEWSPSWMVDYLTGCLMKYLGIYPSDPFLIKDSESAKESVSTKTVKNE
ncbi:Retinol dehydrogenase 5 [Entomortierella chlamydospora]|nr:Retinol dehydrogenase 5 [Entomortierella chlamydospora]